MNFALLSHVLLYELIEKIEKYIPEVFPYSTYSFLDIPVTLKLWINNFLIDEQYINRNPYKCWRRVKWNCPKLKRMKSICITSSPSVISLYTECISKNEWLTIETFSTDGKHYL